MAENNSIKDNNIDGRGGDDGVFLYWGAADNYTGTALDNYKNTDPKMYVRPWIGCDGDEGCLESMSDGDQQLYWTHETTTQAQLTASSPYNDGLWVKALGIWWGDNGSGGGYYKDGYYCPCHKRWTPIRASDTPQTTVGEQEPIYVVCNPFEEGDTQVTCKGKAVDLADGLYSNGCFEEGRRIFCREWASKNYLTEGGEWAYKAIQARDNNLWYRVPKLVNSYPDWHPLRNWDGEYPVMLGTYFVNSSSNMSVPEFLGCPAADSGEQTMFMQFGDQGDNTSPGDTGTGTFTVGEEEYGVPGELFDGVFYKNGCACNNFNWSTPIKDEYQALVANKNESTMVNAYFTAQTACDQAVDLASTYVQPTLAKGCFSTGVYVNGRPTIIEAGNASLNVLQNAANEGGAGIIIKSYWTPVSARDTKLWYVYGDHEPTTNPDLYWASSFDLDLNPNDAKANTKVKTPAFAAGPYSTGYFSRGRSCTTFTTAEGEYLQHQDDEGYESRYENGRPVDTREIDPNN